MVLIIHDVKLVVLENPRAASKSLATMMRHVARMNEYENVEHNKREWHELEGNDKRLDNHNYRCCNVEGVRRYLEDSGLNADEYQFMMSLRNPYTKVFSAYHDHIVKNELEDHMRNFRLFLFGEKHYLNFTLNKMGGESIDHLLRSERLGDDLRHVLKELNIKPIGDYVFSIHKNLTEYEEGESDDWRSYYQDSRHLQFVNFNFESDFENGGYTMLHSKEDLNLFDLDDEVDMPLEFDELVESEELVVSEVKDIPSEPLYASHPNGKPLYRPGQGPSEDFNKQFTNYQRSHVRYEIDPTVSVLSSSVSLSASTSNNQRKHKSGHKSGHKSQRSSQHSSGSLNNVIRSTFSRMMQTPQMKQKLSTMKPRNRNSYKKALLAKHAKFVRDNPTAFSKYNI